MERRAQAALQFHGQAAVAQRRASADPATQACRAHAPGPIRASISDAAAPISARSAPSSTCRAARAASARQTISSRSSATIRPRASTGSSSPTTISPATATGRSCSTGSSSSRKKASHVGFTIQVDTLCHKIPNFIEKATAAGVKRVFIGLENINPENLITAKKRQNKITEYRVMLQKWRSHGAITFAGYILGFPADTKEVDPARHRDHQAGTAARHSRVLLSHAVAGLGGSPEDARQGRLDGPRHQQIRPQPPRLASFENERPEWEDAYRAAWNAFYTLDHIGTISGAQPQSKMGARSRS